MKEQGGGVGCGRGMGSISLGWQRMAVWTSLREAERVSRRVFAAAQWPPLRPRAVFAQLNRLSSRTVCNSSQACVKSQCELRTRLSQYLIFSYKGSLLTVRLTGLYFPNQALKQMRYSLLRAGLGTCTSFACQFESELRNHRCGFSQPPCHLPVFFTIKI